MELRKEEEWCRVRIDGRVQDRRRPEAVKTPTSWSWAFNGRVMGMTGDRRVLYKYYHAAR